MSFICWLKKASLNSNGHWIIGTWISGKNQVKTTRYHSCLSHNEIFQQQSELREWGFCSALQTQRLLCASEWDRHSHTARVICQPLQTIITLVSVPFNAKWHVIPSTREVSRVTLAAFRLPAGKLSPILSSFSLSERPPFFDLALQEEWSQQWVQDYDLFHTRTHSYTQFVSQSL